MDFLFSVRFFLPATVCLYVRTCVGQFMASLLLVIDLTGGACVSRFAATVLEPYITSCIMCHQQVACYQGETCVLAV